MELFEKIVKSYLLFLQNYAWCGHKYLNMLNRRSTKIEPAENLSEQKQDDPQDPRTSLNIC